MMSVDEDNIFDEAMMRWLDNRDTGLSLFDSIQQRRILGSTSVDMKEKDEVLSDEEKAHEFGESINSYDLTEKAKKFEQSFEVCHNATQ